MSAVPPPPVAAVSAPPPKPVKPANPLDMKLE